MAAPDATRILLADDHALVRRGVRLILDGEPDLTVVAEAGDGEEAVDLARSSRDRPGDSRHRHAADDRAAGGARAVGAPTGPADPHADDVRQRAVLLPGPQGRSGGYVLKSVADRDLVEACRAAMRGEPFLYPGAVNALIRNYLNRARLGEDHPGADPHRPRGGGPQARRRGSLLQGDRREPCSSASRPSSGTGRTCCRSLACATGWN